MYKKLYRRKNNRMLLGVCSGMADYFNIDPTVVRVIWVFLSLACGIGLLAYLICGFIIPEQPQDYIDAE